jgi:hypothetical protein
VVVGRPRKEQCRAGEEGQIRGAQQRQSTWWSAPAEQHEPGDADEEKRDIRERVREVRDAQENAPVCKGVIAGRLRDGALQHDRNNRDGGRQQEYGRPQLSKTVQCGHEAATFLKLRLSTGQFRRALNGHDIF